MLLIALIFSGILFIVVNLIARISKTGLIVACSLAGGALLLSCAVSSILAGQALVLLLTGLICLAWEGGYRRFLKWSLVVTALLFAIPVGYGIYNAAEWSRLRDVYPIESMDERLSYERRAHREDSSAAIQTSSTNSQRLVEQEQQIGYQEQQWRTQVRVLSLQHLHSSNVSQFIDAEGFGVGRMVLRPRPSYVEIRDQADPIPLPPSEARSYEYVDPLKLGKAEQPRTEAAHIPGAPDALQLLGLHDEGLLDFANVPGFGYVRDRGYVVGFESHRFGATPGRYDPDGKWARWKIQRLELVSLLKHEEPVAYVSDYLPRMDKLKDAPVRPLDEFETNALKKLEIGKDLEVDYASDRIRMLGSIRALKQCVKCHHAERGELLGAFTYKLKREAAK